MVVEEALALVEFAIDFFFVADGAASSSSLSSIAVPPLN
jgi:hypothetical protein